MAQTMCRVSYHVMRILILLGISGSIGIGLVEGSTYRPASIYSAHAKGSERDLLQATAATDRRLRTHIEHPTLYSDARTCHAEGLLVARGNPTGCGRGCQYASEVTDFSTQYIYEGEPTSEEAIGPPDAYPIIGDSPRAWAPAKRDDGMQYIQFLIPEEVYVTGFKVYENFHPGAVVEIKGRVFPNDNTTRWYTLWSGPPSVPEGSSFYNATTGKVSSTSRVFSPLITAPRTYRLQEFMVTIDTTAVNGYVEIDAFEVHGDDLNGHKVNGYGPFCGSLEDTDCWHTCTEADVLTAARAADTLDVVAQATAWIESALKVAPRPAGERLKVLADPLADPGAQVCSPHTPVPAHLIEEGVDAELVLLVTARPVPLDGAAPDDRNLPLSTACRWEPSALAFGRPLAVHINLPPQYASTAVAGGAGAVQHAVDGVIHHLFLALGWAEQYHTQFIPSLGQNIVSCPNADNPSTCEMTNPLAIWATRDLHVVKTPLLLKHATEHFGAPVQYVELENGGTPGQRGVLLEDRVFHGELMTVPQVGVKMVKSALSLALLQDSGWYFPDYAQAEVLPWGHLQGREFATQPCNLWPSSAAHYVCPTRNIPLEGVLFDLQQLAAPSCVANRRSKGECHFIQHPKPLPSPYQYFIRPEESNYGGPDPLMLADYCPWNVPTATGDCVEPSAGGYLQYFEEAGQASRCFEVTRRGNELLGCIKHFCVEGTLYLKLGHEYLPCPAEGGPLTSDINSITVQCPKQGELCDEYSTEVVPSLRVYEPSQNAVIGPDTKVVFELSNFVVPEDGSVSVTVQGLDHMHWAEASEATAFSKSFMLTGLPEGRLSLGFHLLDHYGDPVYTQQMELNVVLSKSQFATKLVAFSSQSDARKAVEALGENSTGVYGTSPTSWAPTRGGQGPEFIELQVDTPVQVTDLLLWENFGPGGLRHVYAKQLDGSQFLLWAGETSPDMGLERGTPYQPTHVHMRYAPEAVTDTLRLEFDTPSWLELDAVLVDGLLATPPAISLPPAAGQVPGQRRLTLREGETTVLEVNLTNTGTATLYWKMEGMEGLPAWITPLQTSGVVRGGADITLHLELNTAGMNGMAVDTATLTVADMLVFESVSLASFNVVLQVDYSLLPTPTPPPCYHGLVVGATALHPGSCTCEPGAYGQACEFLHCPYNCSTPEGATVQRGLCDIYSGTCTCTAGYTGLDCSGQDGDCYISYSGECRPGWSPGEMMINSEDYNNMNRAAGSLPASMQCNLTGDSYEFGCSPYLLMQFCCREANSPGCPFLPGAAPCQLAGEALANCTEGNFKTPECLEVANPYCFAHPEDPVCNAFSPEAPADYCPLGLAHSWCARHPEDGACAGVVPPRPACRFLEIGNDHPCGQTACQEDLLSDVCLDIIQRHCAGSPEDPECFLFGIGDCFFLPGAAPCEHPHCSFLSDSYDQLTCDGVVDEYCLSLLAGGAVDPECSALGYKPFALTAVPAETEECPRAAIEAACGEDMAAAGCMQMLLKGVMAPAAARSGELPLAASLAAPVEAHAAAALEAFIAAGVAADLARKMELLQSYLTHRLFTAADGNTDGVLAEEEFPTVVAYATALLRLDRTITSTASIHTLAEHLATTADGRYISYSEFDTIARAFFVISHPDPV